MYYNTLAERRLGGQGLTELAAYQETGSCMVRPWEDASLKAETMRRAGQEADREAAENAAMHERLVQMAEQLEIAKAMARRLIDRPAA